MVVICVVLSYFTMGIYYLWITVIAFFPSIQHCREVPYTEDIDIHFFIVIPCLNEESVIVSAVNNVRRTFMKNMRDYPTELLDFVRKNRVNIVSLGQVWNGLVRR